MDRRIEACVGTDDEMDHNKQELVVKLRRLKEENQQLTSLIKLICSNCDGLQTNLTAQHQEGHSRLSIRSMVKPAELSTDMRGDTNNGGCRYQFMDSDVHSVSTVSGRSEERNSKSLLEDTDRRLSLPCKKRKMNYVSAHSADGMGNSSVDGDLQNKKPSALNEGSDYPVASAPKKIVALRRSDATTVCDGCQWRKYGQKRTRNNQWPRAYYKCAMDPSCPVKKQVQRCDQDPSIVITTYQGEHNHVLSAVAMAFVNGALDHLDVSGATAGLMSGNQLPFPASIATISLMGSAPTITLDLTGTPNPKIVPLSIPGCHSGQPRVETSSFVQHWTSLCNSSLQSPRLIQQVTFN